MNLYGYCSFLLTTLLLWNSCLATDRPAVVRRQHHSRYNGWRRAIPAFRWGHLPTDRRMEHVSVKRMVPSPDFFMGITPQTSRAVSKSSDKKQPMLKKTTSMKINNVRESLSDALEEIRQMRKEMEDLKTEVRRLKDPNADLQSEFEQRRKARRKQFEGVDRKIEAWAESILFGANDSDPNDDWTEVQCHKMLRHRYNEDGRTRAHLRWQRDGRDTNDDSQAWPMIRMYSTIDAPIAEVALYLSDASHMTDYNSLIENHKDLEQLSPRSKICWGRTPQVLFVKPRDFITYCAYRWRTDGTLVIVNQALEDYEDTKANAYAFRGATFIGPDADDPAKTRIAMLSHACPGRDVPAWSCRMAIQTLAPVEPYRLFYKINEGIQQSRSQLQATLQERSLEVSSSNTIRPAGIAQMGYACFWPDGASEDKTSDVLDTLE